MKQLREFHEKNTRVLLYLVLACVGLQANVTYSVVFFLQTLLPLDPKVLGTMLDLTSTHVEEYVNFGANAVSLLFMTMYVGTVVILGFSFVIREALRNLSLTTSTKLETLDFYKPETFDAFKRKLNEISNIVACLQDTFKHYVALVTLTAGILILYSVYTNTTQCSWSWSLSFYLSEMAYNLLALLALCVSGSLIEAEASTQTTVQKNCVT